MDAEKALIGGDLHSAETLLNHLFSKYPRSKRADDVRKLLVQMYSPQPYNGGDRITAEEVKMLRDGFEAFAKIATSYPRLDPEKQTALDAIFGKETFQQEEKATESSRTPEPTWLC